MRDMEIAAITMMGERVIVAALGIALGWFLHKSKGERK